MENKMSLSSRSVQAKRKEDKYLLVLCLQGVGPQGTTRGRGLQIEGSSLSAELSSFLRERGKWSMPVGGENAFTNALLKQFLCN